MKKFDIYVMISLLSLAYATLLYGTTKIKPVELVSMTTIDDCIFRELRDCGDKLCEMSYTSNYPIVEQAYHNLKECLKAAK